MLFDCFSCFFRSTAICLLSTANNCYQLYTEPATSATHGTALSSSLPPSFLSATPSDAAQLPRSRLPASHALSAASPVFLSAPAHYASLTSRSLPCPLPARRCLPPVLHATTTSYGSQPTVSTATHVSSRPSAYSFNISKPTEHSRR